MKKDKYVMVIDEDDSSRNGIQRLLIAFGYKVKTYKSAVDFLDDPELCESVCILLDKDLTGISGDDLMFQITARGSNLPVIVISSSDEPTLKHKSWIAQAKGFYRKPIDGRALVDAIDWLLISNSKTVKN